MPSLRTLIRAALLPAVLASLLCAVAAPATANASTVSGSLFKDLNRDGVRQADEAGFASLSVYLFSAAGSHMATAYTDAGGRYAFTGLADGSYTVRLTRSTWDGLRLTWATTTSAELRPVVAVAVPSSPAADIGWRPIVRSTDLSQPISTYVGPNGLRVESFNDVVSAAELYATVMQGSLFGGETAVTRIRFDYHSTTICGWSVAGAPGNYSSYSASCWVSWVSWLDGGDTPLSHEYGHAWSMYHAYLVQQDAALSAYLELRGIADDPRLESSHAWARGELIAEDYRQLFGSATARATAQENRDLPPAASVPGLREYLSGSFMTAGGAPPPATPAPAASAAPVATGTAQDGQAVATSAGTWTNSPTSYAYQWQAAVVGTTSWADIVGATGATYTPGASDVGRLLRARVTAVNAGGSAVAYSNTLGPVAAAPVAATVAVADLDGVAAASGGGWRASVTVTLRTGAGVLAGGAVVTQRWRAGKSTSTTTCTSGALGTCTVSAQIPKRESAVTWTVEGVAAPGLLYAPASNGDPDSDSDGTTITIAKPA